MNIPKLYVTCCLTRYTVNMIKNFAGRAFCSAAQELTSGELEDLLPQSVSGIGCLVRIYCLVQLG